MPVVICPSCDGKLRVKQDSLGRKTRCPECNQVFFAEIEEEPLEVIEPGRKKKTYASGSGSPTLLGGCFLLFLILGALAIVGGLLIQWQQRNALNEASRLYDAGKHEEAVSKYKLGYPSSGDQKAAVLLRIVQHEIGKGDSDEARKWMERGINERVEVAYDGTAAGLYREMCLARASRDAAKAADAEQARLKKEWDRAAREQDKKLKAEARNRILANQNLPKEAFLRLVLDRDGNELKQLLGAPARTQDVDGNCVWFYHNIVLDPASGKKFSIVEIVGDNIGRVKEVNFY